MKSNPLSTILLFVVVLGLASGPAFAAEPASPPAKAKPAMEKAAEPAKPVVMQVGDSLQDLATTDMEGKPVKLNDLVKPNMLNVIAFTNSSCYACASEATLLSSLKGKHMEKINLIGVVVDISPSSYKALPDGVKNAFSFVHDAEFTITPIFGFSSTPAIALVKGGKIIDLKTGFDPAKSQEFAAYIEKNI